MQPNGFNTINGLILRSSLAMKRMNKNLTLVLILMISLGFINDLSAQIIKGEAILGMNLTQVDGDEVFGFRKIGLNVGAGVLIPVDKKGRWDISLEAIYTQKGANQEQQYNDSIITGEYRLNLNYVEVPVLVMFTDKEFISGGLGFAWGRLIGVQEWEHGNLVESTTPNSGTYSSNDFSILGDVRIRIWQGLKFNLRYQYSLVKIRTREFENLAGETWTRDQYNNVLSFRLIYVFNEKKSREYYRDARAQ